MTPSSPETRPSDDSAAPAGFEGLRRWVRFYSRWQLLLVAIILWGAHFFALLGRPWTTCRTDGLDLPNWACIAFFHIYEVPIVALFVYHAWVGLRRFSHATLPAYFYLTCFQVMLLACYVTFEGKVLFDSLAGHSPAHEDFLLMAGGSGMVFGAILGYYTIFHRLMPFFLARRGGEGWDARVP